LFGVSHVVDVAMEFLGYWLRLCKPGSDPGGWGDRP